MPSKFRLRLVACGYPDSARAFDMSNHGKLTMVPGAWWYEDPDFVQKHAIGEVKAYDEHSLLVLVDCLGQAALGVGAGRQTERPGRAAQSRAGGRRTESLSPWERAKEVSHNLSRKGGDMEKR
jgi:hypothetical protein